MNNIELKFIGGTPINCDYRTVKTAYFDAERRFEEPFQETKLDKPSILDDYKRIIDEKLEIQFTIE